MKKNVILISIVLLTVISMMLNSFANQASAAPQAKWWSKFGEPQYGGTIIRRTGGSAISNGSPDPADPRSGTSGFLYEHLFMPDWKMDRSIFPCTVGWTPRAHCIGQLAESWEQPDLQTLIVHIRKGINWHNKAPVNGREFTAEDVQYNFDRVLGTGSGFDKPNPFFSRDYGNFERVVAIDKYTVKIQLKKPSVLDADNLVNGNIAFCPPEWVKQGDLSNWKGAVGTGPWLLKGFVSNSSVTYERNPDYWGKDERYPENKLPYADNLKSIAIDDMTTAVAALRTGKIDMLVEYNGPTLQATQSLSQTNPEIQQAFWPREGYTLSLRCDTKPFIDINVRKAMQMAIDRKTIAQSYFLGKVDGKPAGLINPIFREWNTPYNQWPKEVQDAYSYNVEEAKRLLSEAGYPKGFKTNCVTAMDFNLELLQVVKSYLNDIGVDMEIKTFDMPTFMSLERAGSHDQMIWHTQTGRTGRAQETLKSRTTGDMQNSTFNNDETYDAMFNKFTAAPNLDEAKKLARKMDMYAIEQHWAINLFPVVNPVLWQPWIKGYSGEFPEFRKEMYYTRLWVDKAEKKSMGY